MENKHDIEELEQLLHTTFSGEETQPPADAWQQISERLSQSAAAGTTSSATDASVAGAARSLPHAIRYWLVVVGLVAAAAAITTAVVLSLPRQAEEQQVASTDPVVSLILDEATPLTTDANMTAPTVSNTSNIGTTTVQPTPTTPQPSSTTTIVTMEEPAEVDETPQLLATPKSAAPQEAEMQHQPTSQPVAKSQANNTPKPATIQSDEVDSTPSNTCTEKKCEKKSDIALVIPTLMTPNGDGYNDCWVIDGLDKYSHVEVSIYTARSQRIYNSSDYRNDFCGDDLPKGNYFYVVAIRSEQYITRGVLIIR